MKIGNFEVKHGIFLAPMANITDYAYRSICVSYGAECVCTELIMVNHSLLALWIWGTSMLLPSISSP